MTTLIQILIYLLETFASLFLLFVILRFMLQVARADFYNPISQAIVKITNPLLIPLRRVIPGIYGIDFASIVLALAVQFIFGLVIYLLVPSSSFNDAEVVTSSFSPLDQLAWSVIATLNYARVITVVCLFVIVIASFIAPYSSNPILTLVRQLMAPLMAPFQKLVPPIGGLDLSILFLFVVLHVVKIILIALMSATAMNPSAVRGIVLFI